MGYALEAIAYVGGTMLIGAGLYLVMRGSFPAWAHSRLVWPLLNLTPAVAHLQGWAAIVLGASVIATVFAGAAGQLTAGFLVLFALAAYLVAVGLFLFSTWLSRRPAG